VKVFSFDAEAPWYGHGGGTIQNVTLLDENGNPLEIITGGDEITLKIEAVANQELKSPIIGFYVKDRLGQNLFGNNTYMSYAERAVLAGEHSRITATFKFRLPFMPSGTYSVTAALAEGTQTDHVQHHWIDEAILFKVVNPVEIQGLLGVPMNKINLTVE
jgi:lipopolysaccharide transport system ATP-binding protein